MPKYRRANAAHRQYPNDNHAGIEEQKKCREYRPPICGRAGIVLFKLSFPSDIFPSSIGNPIMYANDLAPNFHSFCITLITFSFDKIEILFRSIIVLKSILSEISYSWVNFRLPKIGNIKQTL